MKTSVKKTATFSPVSLTLYFDNQRELDTFATLLNVPKIANVLSNITGFDPAHLRDDLRSVGADTCISSVLSFFR